MTHFVTFTPSVGQDDWQGLNTLISSVAPGTEIHFVPGATYRCNTRGIIKSHTRLFLHGSQIVCMLPKSEAGKPFSFNHAFTAFPLMYVKDGNEFKTSLTSPASRGSIGITLSEVPPNFKNGDFLRIYCGGGSTSKVGSTYQCVSISGTRTNIILDRPLSESFLAGAVVDFPIKPIRNVHISGEGAVFSGMGDGIVEFSSTLDCVVEGIRSIGDFASSILGGVVFSMDVFGVRNILRDLIIDQRTGGYGFSLETNEHSIMERCWDFGSRSENIRAIWIGSCHDCVIRDCHIGIGTVSTMDGSDNRIEGGSFVGGHNNLLLDGNRNRVINVRFGSCSEHSIVIKPESCDALITNCSFLDTGLESICVQEGAQRVSVNGCTFDCVKGPIKNASFKSPLFSSL